MAKMIRCPGLAYISKIVLVDGTVVENGMEMFNAPIPSEDALNKILEPAGILSEKIFAKPDESWLYHGMKKNRQCVKHQRLGK